MAEPDNEITNHEYIEQFLIQEWHREFERKGKDYGPEHDQLSLGPRAVFVDVWRKACKLRNAIWNDKPLAFEQPREIMLDMIGHLFLMVAQLDRANYGNIRPPRPIDPEVMEDIRRDH
jgi:hypothetical protein